jgi:hypothetical protein
MRAQTSDLNHLKGQLEAKEAELLKVKLELIESKIASLQQNDADKEARLRAVETSRTRFETLAWLAFGGGALSLVNILLRLK